MSQDNKRVAVFIDRANMYYQARKAFSEAAPEKMPSKFGNFWPHQMALLLAARNYRKNFELVHTEIHVGIPAKWDNPNRALVDAQLENWKKHSPKLEIVRRKLVYNNPNDPRCYNCRSCNSCKKCDNCKTCKKCLKRIASEKCIDVGIAVNAAAFVSANLCDICIIVSHDQDYIPAIETIIKHKGRDAIETASWQSNVFSSKIPYLDNPITNHRLYIDDFDKVKDETNYFKKIKPTK